MSVRPNLFVVGAAKAGTTYLHEFLGAHADLFMSPIKETHYFAGGQAAGVPGYSWKRLNDRAYHSMFNKAPASTRYAGESSPSYLWDPEAAKRIGEFNPKAKIVVVLRDPVDRAFSHYLMDVRAGVQSLAFLDALVSDEAVQPRRWGTASHLYVELGMYAAQLERYLGRFAPEQILVLGFPELRNPSQLARRLGGFLEVPHMGFPTEMPARNVYLAPRSTTVARMAGRPFARASARVLLPERTRRLLQNRLVLRRGEKPELDVEAVDWLMPRYATQRGLLDTLLGSSAPDIWSRWQSRSEPE